MNHLSNFKNPIVPMINRSGGMVSNSAPTRSSIGLNSRPNYSAFPSCSDENGMAADFVNLDPMLQQDDMDDSDGDDGGNIRHEKKSGRRKIRIEFIEDRSRRHITFSKRKAGIMKKAYELSTLTGTQVLLLVASETGHVYTFATPKLQPLITKPEGKSLIQACLNAPDIYPEQYMSDNAVYRDSNTTESKSHSETGQASHGLDHHVAGRNEEEKYMEAMAIDSTNEQLSIASNGSVTEYQQTSNHSHASNNNNQYLMVNTLANGNSMSMPPQLAYVNPAQYAQLLQQMKSNPAFVHPAMWAASQHNMLMNVLNPAFVVNNGNNPNQSPMMNSPGSHFQTGGGGGGGSHSTHTQMSDSSHHNGNGNSGNNSSTADEIYAASAVD